MRGLKVLAIATLLPCMAVAQDYHPRAAAYQWSSGSGAPMIRQDGKVDSVTVARLARFGLVTLNATPFADLRPDVALMLRRLEPSQKLLWYDVLAQRFYYATQGTHWAAEWQAVRSWLLDSGGHPFPWGTPANSWLDLGREADTLATLWERNVLWNRLGDGVFADFANGLIRGSSVYGLPVDFARAGYRSQTAMDSATTAGLARFVARMKKRGAFVGNGTAGGKSGWDGELFEGWTGTPLELQEYRASGPLAIVKVESWAAPYSPEWCRAWRYALGCASLGNGWGYSGPDRGPATAVTYPDEASVTPWPSCRVDTTGAHRGWLGVAGDVLEPMRGVFIRRFQFGTVVVNTTGGQHVVDLVRWHRGIYGVHDPITNHGQWGHKFQVGARDALFLVAQPSGRVTP